MPNLAQLSGSTSSANPTLLTIQQNNPVIEPLDGPTAVDDVMDRFPPEVYQQGRDTHLYRFLTALGGDAGAGLIKKLAFNARLYFEAEGLSFQALDQFFSGQFNFNRLKSETYDFDTTGTLTSEQWDDVLLADQSYKQRIVEYFTATRHGNSPEGLRVMGQAGTGIECDLVENYKWVFDQFSDDPLGLTLLGQTVSTSEFIVIPRFLNLSSDIYDQGFEETLTTSPVITAASLPNARPALGGTGPVVSSYAYNSTAQTRLAPEIERNAIDLFDQIRSVGTLATIIPQDTRFINVPVAGEPMASSTRINVTRFVTGKADVPWPPMGSNGNTFIETGVEHEAGYFYGSQRDLPVIFQTVENVHAYIGEGELDPNYVTKAFYDDSTGISTFDSYKSEFTGNYDRNLTAIFPFLLNLDPSNTYTADQAIAAQNTPLVLEGKSVPGTDITANDVVVNGIYPTSFFSLPGVDPIQYPDSFWWASRSRFAAINPNNVGSYLTLGNGGSQTSEVLEIDLGRIREVNYINMDVLAAPINITIEYDDISTPDREAVWLPVIPMGNMPFDNRIAYNADSRSSWFNGEYNFTDNKGNMIHTRYLRITFTRRDEAWPTSQNSAFSWPVFAKHLRVGRYIENYLDTVGPLLVQDTPTGLNTIELVSIDNLTTREVRQQFVFPSDAARGDQTPNLLGFGVLVQTNDDVVDESPTAEFSWSVWDVTNSSAPVQLRNGVETGVVTPGLSWVDFYLPEDLIIVGSDSVIYELRISSINAFAANTVFTHSPGTLSTTAIPGTLTFTNGSTAVSTSVDTRSVVKIGQYIAKSDLPDQVFIVNGVSSSTITINVPYTGATESGVTGYIIYPYSSYNETSDQYVTDGTQNLVMRIWADVADSGRDVLGNSYRYGTRRELADYVFDNTKAGWMSDPIPAPNGVEALYFDLRSVDIDNNPLYAFIDAIRVAPRTPGVQMNIYYTTQNLTGLAPRNETDWDYLLWQPVQASYILRRSEVIQLPHQIKATFLKLEFTNLVPGPFRVPTFPALPPKQYRVFPQWVIDQFSNPNIQDPFLQSQTPVVTQALAPIVDPTYEFANNQRTLLSQLALGTVSDNQTVASGLSSVAGVAAIDQTTAQQIFLNTPGQYQNTQLISVDQNSILGKIVLSRFNPTLFTTPIEGVGNTNFYNSDVGYVSTTNNRISQAYQGITQFGLRFNQQARHTYDVIEAQFNKKAYFVGIDELQFLRNDYTIEHDDSIIDVFNIDDTFVVDTWTAEADTNIPDGAVLYVSYSVNPSITDEQVTLVGFEPVKLATVGGPAFNVSVYEQPNKQGDQYFQGQDYDLQYGYDQNGNHTTLIVRSQLGNRLAVPLQAIVYEDAATVVGVAVIPSEPTDDAAVVTSIGNPITTQEGPFVPDFGAGTFGGGTFGNLTKDVVDSSTATSAGKPSVVSNDQSTDAHTVTSVAVISGSETYTP